MEELLMEGLVVGGVALAPVVSIIISMLKGWAGLDSKVIPIVNVILGAAAVLAFGVVGQGLEVAQAVAMTVGVVFGSSVFHDTFGHAGRALQDILGK